MTWKEVCRHDRAGNLFRLATFESAQVVSLAPGDCEIFKNRVLLFPIEIIRIRNRDARLIGIRFCHDHEPIGIGVRQRPEQDGVDHTKDGGVRPDAERKREDGDESEAGRFAQLAKSETEISYHFVRHYSDLSVTIGSTRAARRAGNQEAATVAKERIRPTLKKIPRSAGWT